MIINYKINIIDMDIDNEYDYMEYEEYEKEDFIRWYYGKINFDEYDKEMEIAFEQEEERRWYYGYEKDY
jgi:hypothetical protein